MQLDTRRDALLSCVSRGGLGLRYPRILFVIPAKAGIQ